MGAFYGHMNHLYDNGSLTFGSLKDMLRSAASGELEGTEKLDGMNLYVSYSVLEGKAKAVRNAGNIKSGGLDAEALAKKFAGREGVEEAFNTAFQGFERAVRTLTPTQQTKIFGKDADIFYNAEVIDDRAVNVINYNVRSLIIHRVGHVYFNKKKGTVEDVDISSSFEALNNALVRMNSTFAKEEFSVQVNAIRNLEKFTDDTILNNAITGVETVQSNNNLSDNNHINDLLAARIVPAVRNLPISTDSKKELILKILNLKGTESITTIKKGLNPEQKQKVEQVWNNRKQLFKDAVLPLEEIIHDFAISALKAFHSKYVLNKSEPENIRRKIRDAIRTIQNSDDERQIGVLMKQLSKLRDIEQADIGTTEGFVFVGPDGVTYKLTANFAPINQILGMSRRSQPIQQLKEEDAERPSLIDIKRTVGIYPGKFKPPHNGHMFSIKEALKKCTNVLVLVAPVERTLADGTQLTWEKSISLLNLFLEEDPDIDSSRVEVVRSSTNSPVRATYEVLEGSNEELLSMGYPTEGDLIIPIRSDKEDPRSGKPDWHVFKNFHHEESPIPNVYAADVTEFAIPSYKGLGATEFRAALDSGDDIDKFIPANVTSEQVYQVLNIKKKEEEPMQQDTDMESSLDEGAFQDKVAKPRTSKSHKRLIDTGRKDLIKHGAPFNAGRPKDKSNAFFAKEEKESKNCGCGQNPCKTYGSKSEPDEVEEASAMSGGGAAGHVDSSFAGMDVKRENEKHKQELKKKKKKKLKREDFKMHSREEIVAEMKLRETIQHMLKKERIKFVTGVIKEYSDNFKLRSILRKLIAESDVEKSPHPVTAINILDRLLGEILGTLEDGYKALTTGSEQRTSYRKHILNAIDNALAPAALADKVEETIDEVEINIKDTDADGEVSADPLNVSDEEKFRDVRNKGKKAEEEEEDPLEDFGIEGEELTGRDHAYRDFKQIEDKVLSSYKGMHDEKDKEIFYDYLLTNIKMHFDNFEEELGNVKGEPESPSYDPNASPAAPEGLPGGEEQAAAAE